MTTPTQAPTLPITIHKDASGVVWLNFNLPKASAMLNLSELVEARVAADFKFGGDTRMTSGLMSLALTAYPTTPPALTAKVRDGVIAKGDKVWWRAALDIPTDGPEKVIADGAHWENILHCGERFYQIAEPKRQLVYLD